MNERIFELAKEADLIRWDTLPSGSRTPDHESVVKAKKFAELIVKECAKIALKSGHITNKDILAKVEAERIYHKIQEHFGVEL